MKFFTKVIIENFQSHERTELELDSGINVIVGQSDKGKSAIIRAIKWVLQNEPKGSDFVRHGTDFCRVTIETSDGYRITRLKKKNKNIYIVQDPAGRVQKFENFGNEIPEEVLQATGVRKIKIDADKDFALNISEQLDPPFLLSETGSVKAKTIGSIVKTHLIDAAERDLQRDILNLSGEVKEINAQIEEIDRELLNYGNIVEQGKIIEKMDQLIQKLQDINAVAEKLQYLNRRLVGIDQEIKRNAIILSKLKNLSELEVMYSRLKEMFQTQKHLVSLHAKFKDREKGISETAETLKMLERLPELQQKVEKFEEAFAIGKTLLELQNALQAVEKEIGKEKEKVCRLKTLSEMQSKADLLEKTLMMGKTLKEKQAVLSEINRGIQREAQLLAKLKDYPFLEQKVKMLEEVLSITERLCESREKQQQINESIEKGKAFIADNERKLNKVINCYAGGLKALGRCPTCLHEIGTAEVSRIIQGLKEEFG